MERHRNFNVFDFMRSLADQREKGEISLGVNLQRLKAERELLQRQSEEVQSAPFALPLNSRWPPKQRDQETLVLQGNGKRFRIQIDVDTEKTQAEVAKHQQLLAGMALDALNMEIRSLESLAKRELPSLDDNQAISNLMRTNGLVKNPSEPGTYRVVKALADILRQFVNDGQTLDQSQIQRYIRDENGMRYSDDTIRTSISRARKDS
jgi:hypothetical protein